MDKLRSTLLAVLIGSALLSRAADASGALSSEPSAATVFFRSGASNHSAGQEDGSASSVVLTMTAP
ncbi:MAG: hypothetical protein M3Z54_03265 [Gemmatimonadota bacterium]|nr:hypothetical protein [Gemmatimonadota bacterium]